MYSFFPVSDSQLLLFSTYFKILVSAFLSVSKLPQSFTQNLSRFLQLVGPCLCRIVVARCFAFCKVHAKNKSSANVPAEVQTCVICTSFFRSQRPNTRYLNRPYQSTNTKIVAPNFNHLLDGNCSEVDPGHLTHDHQIGRQRLKLLSFDRFTRTLPKMAE